MCQNKGAAASGDQRRPQQPTLEPRRQQWVGSQKVNQDRTTTFLARRRTRLAKKLPKGPPSHRLSSLGRAILNTVTVQGPNCPVPPWSRTVGRAAWTGAVLSFPQRGAVLWFWLTLWLPIPVPS